MTLEEIGRVDIHVGKIRRSYKETVEEHEAGGSGSDAACALSDQVSSLLGVVDQLTEALKKRVIQANSSDSTE